MKKIVRGNDFTLRIPVCKIVNGEQMAFPLPACTDIVVNIVNQYRRVSLAYSIDTAEDNIILARVEGDAVSVGTYALEVRGKIFGNDWRSKEYEQFAIVDNNASGDTEFNGELVEGEDSVEMNTALVILPPTAELTQLINDTNTALETAKRTDATLKTNESERISAEQQRASAEALRASEENKRSVNETARHAAEAERVSNEDVRKTAEVQRANAESERIEAENTRTANETDRVAAEKQRVTTFAELSANVDAAVSKANSAASAANTATDKANAEEDKRAEAEKQRATAEATRNREESIRQAAETERVRQETAREAAESARQTAEAERAGNESARKVSESDRVAAEQQRVTAEENRNLQEDARQAAESERVNRETARQTAENERGVDEQERKANETERKTAETQRKKAEETRIAAEASRVSAEEQREATLATTKANCEAATKKASDAASEATIATSKADASAEKANAAAVAAENVDAALANDVLTVTNRNGESTSLQLASYAEVGDVVSEVKHLSETMGAYTDRPDIVLTAKETNKAISASGAKVSKSGWAIAEFTAEKGNVYLFKPNVIDESVCIFAEHIQSVETRGIDYTYTYNSDGTTATATATYLGATHTYTYTYAEDQSCVITDETGAAVDALPMVYETKVGTYSPLVSLNADAELPKDGYCRYMSHFKGNSAIKVVVSYKVGVADLTMKVTRDGVLASVSTQLGNLSQKEDETRKRMDELHGSWVDVLFCAKATIKVDNSLIDVEPRKIYRLYPKKYLNFSQGWNSFCPLVWIDITHWDCSQVEDVSKMFNNTLSLYEIDLTGTDFSNVKNFDNMFRNSGIKKIKGLESLRTDSAEKLDGGGNDTTTGMLGSCKNLTNDSFGSLVAWNTSKMTNISLFRGCPNITETKGMEYWDVSSVTSLQSFAVLCGFKKVSLTKWNTANVQTIAKMLSLNDSLTDVDLSGWDVSNVTDMSNFLGTCGVLKNINLLGWNLCKVKDMQSIFSWNRTIETLKLGAEFFSSPFATTVDFSRLEKWTNDSVHLSLVDNLFDRRANGLPDFTLALHANTKKVLTEDDIATITAKGYIIA